MGEHEDIDKMTSDTDAIFKAALAEAARLNPDLYVVVSLKWPCGCITVKDNYANGPDVTTKH